MDMGDLRHGTRPTKMKNTPQCIASNAALLASHCPVVSCNAALFPHCRHWAHRSHSSSAPAPILQSMAAQPDIIMVDSESDSGDSQEIEIWNTAPRHDFIEVFSPPRVTFACQRQGLVAEHGIDIVTGFDLNTFEGQLLGKARPRFLMLSPPCTMYSALQGLFNLHKMNPQVLQQRMVEADSLLKFAMFLCKRQHDRGAFFCFEHPHRATSWQRPFVQAILNLPGCQLTAFDQCQTGLVTPGENPKPIRKRTLLMSNAPAIQAMFGPMQCNCPAASHVHVQGSVDGIRLSTWCQRYTPGLCNNLAEAVARTLGHE